jgi:hypothetical protein
MCAYTLGRVEVSSQIKKPNALLAAINRAVPKAELYTTPPAKEEASPTKPASVSPEKSRPKNERPSRSGTKLVAGHFDPKVARQIRIIAAEEDTTVQALLEEALDLLFIKKGKAHIKDMRKT